MVEQIDLPSFLADARVDPAVFDVRPDYRVLLVAVSGVTPGPSDEHSEALLVAAEAEARVALATTPVDQVPTVAAWREAYRAFGAKPQRTRNSLEALLRRAESGLPRVNRLTDIYNAISVSHHVPLGGEDLARYAGPPQLVRSDGTEPFATTTNGQSTIEHPEPGEVVWRDDVGVTCRRWNWRQTSRTQLRDATTAALFILDALDPIADEDLAATAQELLDHLFRFSPTMQSASRRLDLRTSSR